MRPSKAKSQFVPRFLCESRRCEDGQQPPFPIPFCLFGSSPLCYLGIGNWGLGFRFRISGIGFRFPGSEIWVPCFRVSGFELTVLGCRFRTSGSRFGVSGNEFRVSGTGHGPTALFLGPAARLRSFPHRVSCRVSGIKFRISRFGYIIQVADPQRASSSAVAAFRREAAFT